MTATRVVDEHIDLVPQSRKEGGELNRKVSGKTEEIRQERSRTEEKGCEEESQQEKSSPKEGRQKKDLEEESV